MAVSNIPVMNTPGRENTLARLRSLEERINNVNRKVEVLENNFIEEGRRGRKEDRALDSEMVDLKREVEKLNEKVGLIIQEMQLLVGKEDFNVLKKYIELWNPMRFITKEELERRLGESSRKDLNT